MSHRTQELPQLTGIQHYIRELRYHEASRQLLGVLLAVLYAVVAQPEMWMVAVASPLVLIGIVLRLWCSGHIKKNEVLATDGPYAFVRHPLYSGNILVLAGFALISGRWWAFPLLILFLLFYYPTAIEYEDRKLRHIFGGQWDAWGQNTPALIPALSPGSGRSDGNGAGDSGGWSLRTSMNQNWEPVQAVFLLALFMYALTRLN